MISSGSWSVRLALAGLLAFLMSGFSAPARAEDSAEQFRPVRMAIEDLTRSFGPKYANGQDYLRRLEELETAARNGRDVRTELADLRREALLANPLLNFEDLLLIRRKANRPGLATNWQSNCSMAKTGYDNEIAVLSPPRPGGKITMLFQPDGGKFVGDVDLDFDAGKMLFSMPGVNGRWQICEILADGTHLRELPLIGDADVDNYDACYLPDGNIIFTSTAPMTGVPCVKGSDHVSNLYHYNSRTGAIRRLSFEQDHDWCPTVMNDGRVMYLRWEYTDLPHYVGRIMFRMNPDGTGQMALYGSNSYWPNSMFYARPIPGSDSRFVAVVSGHHDTRRMGELVLFDTDKGRHEAEGAIQRIGDYGERVQPIIRDGLVGGSWPKFLHPWPLSDKYFIVSCKPTPKSEWGVYLVDVFDNMVLLAEQPGYMLLEPIPFRKTPRPPVIPDAVDPDRKDAVMYLADVYRGPGLKNVPRGAVKTLRLFTYHFAYWGMGGQINRVGMDGPWDIKRVLGTVPVEADGSAYFRVPANTPISIQPLDAEGKAMQLMRSWTTAMPGETKSCVGCHEHARTVATNRNTIAGRREPSEITPFYGPTRGFSFKREVQPVLDRHCVGCHDGKMAAVGRPDFSVRPAVYEKVPGKAYAQGTKFSPSYLALRRYVRGHTIESDMHLLEPMEFHADTTALIQLLGAGHHNVRLDAESWDRLITWIDLNTPAHGTWSEIVGEKNVTRYRDRRRELLKRYAGIDEDPEAIVPQPGPVKFVMPPAESQPRDNLSCEGWPFDAARAKRRQQETGADEWAIDLGPGVKLRMVPIPTGQFIMGSVTGQPTERPRQVVRIDRPFWMGKFEVTNRQYARFDAGHDSRLEHGDFLQFSVRERGYPLDEPNQPVCHVSWNRAAAFCRWLSERTGENFALPTEAQWEYACRAGAASAMWYGPADANFATLANLADASLQHVDTFGWSLPSGAVPPWRPAITSVNDKHRVSAAVGSFRPNLWGLYDMHGNVAEWTRSAFKPYPYREDDGRNDAATKSRRVVRGGSWYDRPSYARSASRLGYWPWQEVYDVGFRVVCESAGAGRLAKRGARRQASGH